MGEAFLDVERISKRFGDTLALVGVSLAIRRGELFALLGSSGCGKSTLLRTIAGLEEPDTGRIALDGHDLAGVPAHRRPIAMMFQSYALFPHLSVAGNVAFGLRQLRPALPRAEIARRVGEMLERVQMAGFADRRPHELSGGQQQRVALARSLVRSPKLLLLDEPLSALDRRIRAQTRSEIVSLVRRVGVTCVLVTHDQEEAMTMADRIGVLSARGELLQVGSPAEVYERPDSRYTAGFIGETNLFEGIVDGARLRCADLAAPLAIPSSPVLADGSPAWLSVRPEKIRVGGEEGAENRIRGRLLDIAYFGSHSLLRVGVGRDRALLASVVHSAALSPGDEVWLGWRAADGVLLTR